MKTFKFYLDLANHYAALLQLVVLTITAMVGLVALISLNISKAQIRASAFTSLTELEVRIYTDATFPGHEYLLSAIYFRAFNEKDDYKKQADLFIDTVAQCSSSLSWNTIPELHSAIMQLGRSSSSSDIEAYNKLMCALSISDRIFSVAQRAFELYQSDIISNTEWKIFEPYICDFAQSPLFLCAIYLNHQAQYFGSTFAEYIQNEYLNDREIKSLVNLLYPEMFKKDWIEQVKKI